MSRLSNVVSRLKTKYENGSDISREIKQLELIVKIHEIQNKSKSEPKSAELKFDPESDSELESSPEASASTKD